MIPLRHDAMKIVPTALAEALRPPDLLPPSKWAAMHLIVSDGPRAGQALDLAMTPYLIEPLDMLGPESPVNEIAVMKSAQTGFTLLLLALLGFLIARAPCEVLVVQPTSDAAADFNRGKPDITIKASPTLRRKVAAQSSRSSEGSTTYSKRFPGVHYPGDFDVGGGLALEDRARAAARRDRSISGRIRGSHGGVLLLRARPLPTASDANECRTSLPGFFPVLERLDAFCSVATCGTTRL